MKKYLGSKMTAYAAIIAPFFVLGPLLFGVYILSAEVSSNRVLGTRMYCMYRHLGTVYKG